MFLLGPVIYFVVCFMCLAIITKQAPVSAIASLISTILVSVSWAASNGGLS